jgi:hypothetical protein
MLPTSEGPPARHRRQPAPLTPPEACKAVPHQVRGLDGQIRRTGTLWSRFVGVTDGAGRAQHADLKRQQQDRPGDPGRGRDHRDRERGHQSHDLNRGAAKHRAILPAAGPDYGVPYVQPAVPYAPADRRRC